MLMNIGEEVVYSKSGLLTTVGFQFGESKPIYALEGSVSVCGSGINWLVKNLGLFSSAKECDEAASKVENSEGVIIVPAFSGLFAPYWNPKAKAYGFFFLIYLLDPSLD
jgi:glycerol kinase